MSTLDQPDRTLQQASAAPGVPRAVAAALVVVLLGATAFAVQSCGGSQGSPPVPTTTPPPPTAPTAPTVRTAPPTNMPPPPT